MTSSKPLLWEAARRNARALHAPLPCTRLSARSAARRIAPLLVLLIALWAVLAARPARAQDLGADAQAIVTAINEARVANNLLPVRVNGLLNQAAQNHVDDLVANGMYGHYGSDGSNVRTRVARTGYPSGWVSENWVTSGSPASAMDWWMNDWIHRVNILTPHWDEVGVGIAALGNGYFIYVTDFANSTGQPARVVEPTGIVTDLSGGGSAAETVQVPPGGMDYVIQGGDTLFGIALRYGLDWQDIAVANGLGEFDLLSIGRTIRLPGVGGVGGPVAAGGLLYTVSPGDTLIGIAARYDIVWEDIASANGLGEWSVLQIGMQLRLPGVPEEEVTSEEVTSEEVTSDQSDTDPLVTNQLVTDQPVTDQPVTDHLQYTVRAGETAWSIAAAHGIGVDELLAANGMDDGDVLAIGQELSIPGQPAPAPQPAPAAVADSPQTAADTADTAGAADTADTGTAVAIANAESAPPAPPAPPARPVGAAPPAAAPAGGFNVSLSSTPWSPPAPGATAATVASAAPGAGADANAAAPAPARTYTVQPGDTVWTIAARTGVDWRALLARNGMREDSLLQVGQILTLD